MVEDRRIRIIDGFRCIAVLSVIIYHYYYRFAPPTNNINLYPYQPIAMVKFGYYGVQLFFVISGFVIFQSLEFSSSFFFFIKKRLIRLYPAMFLCSLVTYVVVQQFDYLLFFRENIYNFLFSFSFLSPDIWNTILRRTDVSFIDGAYWSLWVEIVFYISSSLIFFLTKGKSYLRVWLILATTFQLLRIITSPRLESLFPFQINSICQSLYSLFFFFGINQWIYFSLGIFFFNLYKKREATVVEKGLMFALCLLELFFLKEIVLKFLFVTTISLFLIFIYRPYLLSFLEKEWIVLIGVISYPLYLIHENVGIVLLTQIARNCNFSSISLVIPIFVLFLVIAFSYAAYTIYERPLIRYLNKILL